MMAITGIVLSLILLMFLAYRGINVLILAPLLALLAVLFSGEGSSSLAIYTQIFMKGLGEYVIKYFPVFMLGAIFGKLMDDSGAAKSIAYWLIKLLGRERTILAISLASSILTYGGVSLFVVGFAVYPIGAAIFLEANIPRRLIPAAIAIGSLTFTMVALPGTPAIQNAIPMPFFGTDSFAAPGLGIIGSIIMLVGGVLWLNYRARKMALAGEGFGVHIKSEEEGAEQPTNIPSITIALIPIIVVISSNFLLTKWLLPLLDHSYLATPKYGTTTLSAVLGIWSIITALVLACVAIVILNIRHWKDLKSTINKGTLGALLPIFNTASEVGYGSVIASLGAFVVVKNFLVGLAPNNPLISVGIFVNVMAGVTGSASGGLSIALNTMGETYLHLANQFNISPELMHRIASMASAGLDCLPHNGAVISLLAICGLTHRQSYPDIFMVAVLVPIIALIVVLILASMFGSF